ncbi:MAG: MgtC/SapB family protein [Candidatus Omnitrophica bacterium]|nr:MgtC/SapB family protein [Candidatus Omnitrophota bacterium]
MFTPGDIDLITKLFLAALLGAAIGFEREFNEKAAGFRTHALVCLGSALIMEVSLHVYRGVGGISGDPGRIAAQVVSGIGFLGAGTIIRGGAEVRGLTTAASLWTVAGIGLAVGAGMYVAALVSTVVVLIVLFALGYVGHSIAVRRAKRRVQQNS